MALGENLFTLSERRWKQIGPVLSPYFHGSAFSARLSRVSELVAEDVAGWPTNCRLDLDEATSRVALRTALWLLFGEEIDVHRANELVGHQRALMDWLGGRISRPSALIPFAVGTTGRATRHHRDGLHCYIRELIERRRRADTSDDVLTALLAAKPHRRRLSDKELCGHVAGFIGAGNEVTAATLAWGLVFGAQNPQAFASLPDSAQNVHNYVLETIRLSSCAWSVTRRSNRATRLAAGGVSVRMPHGSAVMVYLRGMNRSSNLWSDPETFEPARHFDATRSQQRSFIPFGLGLRGCIAQQLALAELTEILPIVARKGPICIDGEITEEATFATRVKGGLWGQLRQHM